MAAQPSPTESETLQTIAILPLSGTTVTATVPPSTSGVAVVDGTTLTFRHEGITLSNGQVFSLGFDGLVASTTTATYEYVSVPLSDVGTQSVRYDSTRHPTGTSVVVTEGTTSLPPNTPLTVTTTSGTTSGVGSSSASTTTPTSSTSMTTDTESSTLGSQTGSAQSSATPSGSGSGAQVRAKNVGWGGLFVAGLGLVIMFGAMVGL